MAGAAGGAFLSGFGLGLSLILAIGAQNAFILRQGLRGEHVFVLCGVCATSDAVLIAAGVAGFTRIVEALPWLAPVMRWGGAAFLAVYAARAFRAAIVSDAALVPGAGPSRPLGPALATCLALTWLNPHVYLDTLVLLGSISTRFGAAAPVFGAGAVVASFVFFFALGYGAALLRPVFARPAAWRWLEAGIGAVMSAIALKLMLGA